MHLNTAPAASNSDAGASADDISLDKDILRSQIRPRRLTARSHRGERGQQQMQELFTAHILEAVAQRLHSPGTIAAYLPTKSEPPIIEALTRLHKDGHRILVPVVRPGRKLAWVHWDPAVEHPLSPMGIPEPEGEEQDERAFVDADLRLIPALAFDAGGHRLGQGGGYYDRIIPLLSAQQLEEQSIGIVFSDEIYEAVPYDQWDAILPVILTERGIFHAHQQG
ncbi:5-formyltetrahydrofolate cyclo-ligase [Rothia sp. HMSC068E02]|uniref:5-formyltetrahydrofolate cyclo-ligase n=1 Tax=Rothia sp. HMSC068E02 TaxID=1739423 RepID=UPI000A7486B0|nr:5-formyltetrahydrofolate cyclo-ligase [Rothia sp. HMSC068E02]